MVRKAMLFWSDFELPDGWDMYLLARYSPVLAWLPIGMAWLLPLGVVGALVEFKRNSAVRLLVGFITFYAAAVILFFIFSRYRVYVLPALAVLAALGLRWIAYAAAARDLRRGVAAAFGMAAVGGLSVFGLKLMAVRMADSAQAFMNLAAVYYEKGDAASAERLLADAMREFPKSPAALCGMGRLQLAKGYWRVSADLLTRCLGHNQRYPQAWFSLGQAYQTGGLLVDAANAYRKQLELVPGHLEAAQMLAEIEVALARSRR
jgi:tetratricopeptide (TPR) repeat protein